MRVKDFSTLQELNDQVSDTDYIELTSEQYKVFCSLATGVNTKRSDGIPVVTCK